MTENEVLEKIVPLIREVSGAKEGEVTMDSYLMADLGAESIDLLDLSFLIEETFDITIEADEFESSIRQSLGGADYEKDGYLTPDALVALGRILPEVDKKYLQQGLRKIAIPSVLNVAVFVHMIQRKLDSEVREVNRA